LTIPQDFLIIIDGIVVYWAGMNLAPHGKTKFLTIQHNTKQREVTIMLQTRLRPSTQLRPLTTAHLAQTMALIELSAVELEQKVQAELAQNPALEVKDTRRCPICEKQYSENGPCPRCHPSQTPQPDQPIIFVSPRYDFTPSKSSEDTMQERDLQLALDDLPTYVLKQIAPELPPEDRKIAAYILSNLDEDGLLEVPVFEVARYYHVPPSRVEKVINLIQHADPIGVGSPSPQDALLVQLDSLAEHQAIPPKAAQAIEEGLDLLSRHQYAGLARKIEVSVQQVESIAQFITDNLNPFPGRAFWGDIRTGQGDTPPVFHQPDAIITPVDDSPDAPLMVEVFSPYAGILRINPLFRQAIQQVSEDNTDKWKSDLGRAELLVKCLQQRTTTIVRLMRSLAVIQRNFILHGDQHLTPQTRANLAEALEVHESTVSRAVSNKTVQMPNGHIIPLSKFFDRSLQVRTALKQIIDEEETPLSDNVISELLNEQGYSVARRTVAKYRAMEGILPSHLRQSQCVPEAA
jgi:RNA polymerase sigma-54 factor